MSNQEEIIKELALSSPYLSTLIVKDKRTRAEMEEIISNWKGKSHILRISYKGKYPFHPDSTDRSNLFLQIRIIKNRETGLIALRDFLHVNTIPETLLEISDLADFCIDYSIKSLFSSSDNRHGLTYEILKSNLLIIGMGKLGGGELNFSSDIDLIFLGKDESLSDEITAHNIDTFLKALLNFISSSSSEGFLYRIDMRLRPEGNDGPLVMGVQNAIEYYGKRGRKWEHQAMIKKRLVWGNPDLYEEFSIQLDNIIYRHHEPQKIVYDIKRIKNEIEINIRRKNLISDIKHSPGGIRDIEFIIQFLQLIHGIRYPEIRTSNSLAALTALNTFHIITHEEYATLNNGYITLRKIENIIQLKNNTPEYSLPENEEDIENLFSSWKIEGFDRSSGNYGIFFKNKVLKIMSDVREIFTSLFDETIQYLELKDNLLKIHPDSDKNLLNDHFLRMDSEYFLRFTENDIYSHLEMISKLDLENPVELETSEIGQGKWKLTIVAFDYYYEFSKIAGLISSNYLKIISGESFTYSNYSPAPKGGPDAFYRRKEKRIYPYSPPDKSGVLINRRKIVCTLIVSRLEGSITGPDWKTFKNELTYILNLLENNRIRESEEFLNNKILVMISGFQYGDAPSVSPVDIDVDNESSSQYTILNICSRDSFAFLYTFTNVLALNDYYIFKIEIDTVDESVFDRIFILTRDGKKILEAVKIENLKIAVALIKQYSAFLQNAVDPNKALRHFDELLMKILESGGKKELPLLGQKEVQEKLAAVFGIGDYFWEDLIRFQFTDLLPILNDPTLELCFSADQLKDRFSNNYLKKRAPEKENLNAFSTLLNEWKDAEMFRIDLRQILKKTGMMEFSLELTDLAESVIELAFQKIDKEMQSLLHVKKAPPWEVFGLGKLGGRELGYASDIEIMFVYDDSNLSSDNKNIASYFEKFIQTFLRVVHSKSEGIFEIDLNLRPYGKSSMLPVSKSSFLEYFREGKAYYFEKQALVKLRPICGGNSPSLLIKDIISCRDRFVYGGGKPDISALLTLREKQIASNVRNPNLTNIKYSKGCLVDIEYLVQTLQIAYGKNEPSLMCESTVAGIEALLKTGIIKDETLRRLKESYLFFRNLINILRMAKGNAKDLNVYPETSMEFNYLVRRSYFIGIINEKSPSLLKNLIERYRNEVMAVFNDEIGKINSDISGYQ